MNSSVLTIAFCTAIGLVACAAQLEGQNSALIPDTRGPVQNAGQRVVVSSDGIEAPDFSYKPFDAVATWSAQWINSAVPGVGAVSTTLLRKEVTLDQAPAKVTAYMTGGDYILYINGRMASRGPVDAGRDFKRTPLEIWFYDARDLTPLFHQGKNVIAVECFAGPGFLFQAKVQNDDRSSATINSDTMWRGTPAAQLKHRQFDAKAEPVGWQVAGFDDSTWAACLAVPAPKEPLIPSEIPSLMEARYPAARVIDVMGGVEVPDKPFQDGHSITVKSDASFSVRYDRVMAGRLGIAVKGGKGAQVSIDATELPNGISKPKDFKPYVLTLRDGLQYFEEEPYCSLGTIHIAVSKVTSPVEILDVSADATSQPVAYQGSFTSNDTQLNQIWKDCRWATQINLQLRHLDSPTHQEPICDYGDYLIEDLVTYQAFGDNPWLARQDLRKWAWVMKNQNYDTFHTSYRLLWLQALLNYYDYTGDKALVVELAPYVHDLLDQFTGYIGKNGILSNAPNYMFMDWVSIEGFSAHHPPAVIGQGYLTAFFYKALADGIRVAELTNHQDRAVQYEALRQKIYTAYNRELWDAGKGLYRDGKPNENPNPTGKWLPPDQNIETFSAQNNSLAVLYDLAPADRQASIIKKVMTQTPWNVRPYFMHFVFEGIAHAGLFDQYGAVWMRKWKINPDTQTFQEMGDSGDFSHGWVATPLIQMSTQILGITPKSPNFDAISIRPSLCDLTSAQGRMPTAHGPVKVEWKRQPNQLSLAVTIPPGTTATVAFPVGQATSPQITVSGTILWPQVSPAAKVGGIQGAKRVGPTVEIQITAGTYQLQGTGLP